MLGPGDLRARRLHFRESLPGLMIDADDAPPPAALACIEIEPRYRAIVRRESEAGLRCQIERDRDCCANCAAMRNRDNAAIAMRFAEVGDRGPHPRNEIGKTFAAWRAFVGRREPETSRRGFSVRKKLRAVKPLPFAEILFRESGDFLKLQASKFVAVRRPDRPRRLMRATQIACDPHRVARQHASQRHEHVPVAAIAGKIALAVDAPAIVAHRGMPHPEETRARKAPVLNPGNFRPVNHAVSISRGCSLYALWTAWSAVYPLPNRRGNMGRLD